MSAAQLRPPQTYSRLFRPWDSKNSKDLNESDLKQNNINSLSQTGVKLDPRVFFEHTVPAVSPNELLSGHPAFEYSPSHTMDAVPNEYYGGNSMAGPFFGMDPVSISLMEQEYARVIAEDAHIKALNARKQRPKKFKCLHCNVAFSNNGQLKGHVRIHTGERPFKCDVETCGKTFTRNEELTRHKRIHTGLRPFACSVCGKKFGRRDHLKKHTKTHIPPESQLRPAIFVPMYPYLYGY